MTPRRWKLLRRSFAVLGPLAAIFSFFAFDLVRNEGHLSTAASFVLNAEQEQVLEVWLLNNADVPLSNLNAVYQYYRADGSMVLLDADNDQKFTLAEQDGNYFTPVGMTIGKNSSVIGEFYDVMFDQGLGTIQSIWICGIHDGSFWIDEVRAVYVLERPRRGQSFGQMTYEKTNHFFRSPKCERPASLPNP